MFSNPYAAACCWAALAARRVQVPSASMILPTSFCFWAAENTISSRRYSGST